VRSTDQKAPHCHFHSILYTIPERNRSHYTSGKLGVTPAVAYIINIVLFVSDIDVSYSGININ